MPILNSSIAIIQINFYVDVSIFYTSIHKSIYAYTLFYNLGLVRESPLPSGPLPSHLDWEVGPKGCT